MTGPLSGIRVVEFSHMVMGPSCGLVLGDLGAEVIKVEPLSARATIRAASSGRVRVFSPTFNRNKKSLVLDLKTEQGLALREAADRARRCGDRELPSRRARSARPRLRGAARRKIPASSIARSRAFSSGPYENRAALDEVVQMMGGLAYMTGPPGQAAARRHLRSTTSWAACSPRSAFSRRCMSAPAPAKANWCAARLFENNVFLVAQHMAQFAVTGKPAPPMPARMTAWGIYDVFDTGDGEQIFLGVVTDTQWAIFCRAFELPEPVRRCDARDQSRSASRPATGSCRSCGSCSCASREPRSSTPSRRRGFLSRRSRSPRISSTTRILRRPAP